MSVALLVPKTKHCCTTNQLLTRVDIARACQVIGHTTFWSKVCSSLDFEMDGNLLSILKQRDTHKQKKNIWQSTIKGKKKCSTNKHTKINKEHKEYIDGYKEGCLYKTGIKIVKAKKSLPKAGDRNLEGIPKDQLRWPYYHLLYCQKLGHSSCANKDSMMKVATKEEWVVALKVILAAAVQMEMAWSKACGDIYFVKHDYICFNFMHTLSKLVSIFFRLYIEEDQNSLKKRTFHLRAGYNEDGILHKKSKKKRQKT